VNVLGTQNLFEAVLSLDRRPWMLLGSSSAVYGSHPDPIDEGSPISPATFYAITKAAQELVALQDQFARDLTVAITRTFNLVGPGLQEKLLLGDAARQIVRIERGDVASLNLGNLDTRRDFLDVRDAARAYVLLAQAAGTGIYNVCSGTSYSVRESIGMLTRLAEVDIDVKVEKGRLRSSDVATQVGSHERLTEATGWEPRIPLEQSLADLLAECRREAHS
jgi:GDP-4-dehydro-6-deoxy-D-mannose reductase